MRDATTRPAARFMGWRDLTITPAVELALLAGAIVPALELRGRFEWSGLSTALAAYVLLVAETVAFLALLRAVFPWAFTPGVSSAARDPWRCYLGLNLYGFLLITNLTLQCNHGLVPPPIRGLFYWLLGAKVGRGILPIAGRVVDPHMVEIGASVMIGDDALVLGHGVNVVAGQDVVVLAKVTIGDSAIVGARAVIMPGVTIGEHAMVAAMSFVPMGTVVPPYEIWGGFPAKRISTSRPPVRPNPAPASAPVAVEVTP